jgi:PIN domain nuclease of toxin-antitoxin system
LKKHYLLDTHVILALVESRTNQLPKRMREEIVENNVPTWVSVASIWELAIKERIGKLPISTPLGLWPDALFLLGVQLLEIKLSHVLADIGPEPDTNDPFDRLLLGASAAESFDLVTLDRALVDHPLSWRG